jgi:putative transcriptional regulator
MKLILKEYLIKNKISVYSLEKKTKISHKALYDMVNGKTKSITFVNLGKVCKALNCTPNDIFEINSK